VKSQKVFLRVTIINDRQELCGCRIKIPNAGGDMTKDQGRRKCASMVFLIMILSISASALQSTSVVVGTATELANAISSANSSGGNISILLRDGTYTLAATQYVNAPNVTVASQSGDRTKVVIQGDAMSANAVVKSIFRVTGSHFTVRDVTMQKVGWHVIQIVGEQNADYPTISNCIIRDAYEQLLKISQDSSNPNVTGDNGLLENCLFEYSAGIGPEYYIGGLDAHGSQNWVVRGNVFRSIISPSVDVSEHAIHIWDAPSANNLVEKNLIVNCDRGIGFGLGDRGSSGGIIRNNIIYHASGNGSYADVPIGIETCPNTQIYNNTIFLENGYPNAIEYRFSATKNLSICNNLTNRNILARDGGSATLSKNVTNAVSSWFKALASGDLHLASAVSSVVDAGQAISGLTDDFDSQSRPAGAGIDIGADEYVTAIVQPPTNVRIAR
jgi:hypothetical protein